MMLRNATKAFPIAKFRIVLICLPVYSTEILYVIMSNTKPNRGKVSEVETRPVGQKKTGVWPTVCPLYYLQWVVHVVNGVFRSDFVS